MTNTNENPFLLPVHGISLHDYTAMCIKLASGVDYKDICKAMGIEATVWEEINTIWTQRMSEDDTSTVVTLFGQYFGEPATNAKLEALGASVSDIGKVNLEKMKTDQYFYEELEGARQAAYDYGLDGAQWILDNFDINLADFQIVAMMYQEKRNADLELDDNSVAEFLEYRDEKQKEYAEKFAEEQGGNAADDVKF